MTKLEMQELINEFARTHVVDHKSIPDSAFDVMLKTQQCRAEEVLKWLTATHFIIPKEKARTLYAKAEYPTSQNVALQHNLEQLFGEEIKTEDELAKNETI